MKSLSCTILWISRLGIPSWGFRFSSVPSCGKTRVLSPSGSHRLTSGCFLEQKLRPPREPETPQPEYLRLELFAERSLKYTVYLLLPAVRLLDCRIWLRKTSSGSCEEILRQEKLKTPSGSPAHLRRSSGSSGQCCPYYKLCTMYFHTIVSFFLVYFTIY